MLALVLETGVSLRREGLPFLVSVVGQKPLAPSWSKLAQVLEQGKEREHGLEKLALLDRGEILVGRTPSSVQLLRVVGACSGSLMSWPLVLVLVALPQREREREQERDARLSWRVRVVLLPPGNVQVVSAEDVALSPLLWQGRVPELGSPSRRGICHGGCRPSAGRLQLGALALPLSRFAGCRNGRCRTLRHPLPLLPHRVGPGCSSS